MSTDFKKFKAALLVFIRVKGLIISCCCLIFFRFSFYRGGNVTSLGRQMTEFPLSPGLSRTVIHSVSLGCEDLVGAVAAMLSVENVFVNPGGKKNLSSATQVHKELAEEAGGTNDFATLLYIYRQCHSRLSDIQAKVPGDDVVEREYTLRGLKEVWWVIFKTQVKDKHCHRVFYLERKLCSTSSLFILDLVPQKMDSATGADLGGGCRGCAPPSPLR